MMHVSEQRGHIGAGVGSVVSDEDLFEQFLLGDDRAFTLLYERYDGRVLTYLRTVLRDTPEVVDDIFQETYVRVFRERTRRQRKLGDGEEYPRIRNVRSWLFRIAHNLAISHLRALRKTVSLSEEEEPARWDERLMVPIEESFAQIYGDNEEARQEALYNHLMACVDLLPQSLREVYMLREVNGMEYEEVAAIVGCTQEAARMRISRARRALRKALEKLIEG